MNIKNETRVDSEVVDGIEISLEYIDILYKKIISIKKDRIGYNKRKKVYEIIERTKRDVDAVLGVMPVKKILRYLEIREPPYEFECTLAEEKRLEERDTELKKLHKKYFVEVHTKLYELMKDVSPSYINDDMIFSLPGFDDIFDDFLDHIPYLRLDPLKLIFNVWHKAFKIDKNSNNKKIEKYLWKYKEKTNGTNKGYLFNSLDDDKDLNGLRQKSLYGLKSFYYEIADSIYKRSFIEKIGPREYKTNLEKEERLIQKLHYLYSLAKQAGIKSLIDECKQFMNNDYKKSAKITTLRKFVSKFQDRLLEHEDELMKKTDMKIF